MKLKFTLISLLSILILPVSAFAAIATPSLSTSVPSQVDATTYTLNIKVAQGSKVSVVGGPSDIAPVVDGAGTDKLDGVVKVTVGLAKNSTNVFSIVAEKNGEFSSPLNITIKQSDTAAASADTATTTTKGTTTTTTARKGDVTPPAAPVLDPIDEKNIANDKYMITGSCEASANIYADVPDGTRVGSASANSNGLFSVEVKLTPGKLNRINVYAEDAAGNIGPAYQAVIVAPAAAVKTETAQAAQAGTTQFSDIVGHWAEEYITQIYEKGIVNGKSADKFDPNAYITRAELTKIALKAFDKAPQNDLTEDPFADVPKTEWYAPFVAAAKELNIVSGFSDGFHPNEPVTRAGAIKILLLASGLNIGDTTPDFPDVAMDAWYAKYVAYAKANSIAGGYSDGNFRPDALITRAEVAKIVVKIMGLLK